MEADGKGKKNPSMYWEASQSVGTDEPLLLRTLAHLALSISLSAVYLYPLEYPS